MKDAPSKIATSLVKFEFYFLDAFFGGGGKYIADPGPVWASVVCTGWDCICGEGRLE